MGTFTFGGTGELQQGCDLGKLHGLELRSSTRCVDRYGWGVEGGLETIGAVRSALLQYRPKLRTIAKRSLSAKAAATGPNERMSRKPS